MNEHLAEYLFRNIEDPARNVLASFMHAHGTAETDHILHGRIGFSLCLLYTNESITSTPIKPCTIYGSK